MGRTPTEDEKRKAVETVILKPAASVVVLTVGGLFNCFGIGSFKKTWRFTKRNVWGVELTPEEQAEEEAERRSKTEARRAKELARQEAERRSKERQDEIDRRVKMAEDSVGEFKALERAFYQKHMELYETDKVITEENPWWWKRRKLIRKRGSIWDELDKKHIQLFVLEAKLFGRDEALESAKKREEDLDGLDDIESASVFQDAPCLDALMVRQILKSVPNYYRERRYELATRQTQSGSTAERSYSDYI